MAWYADLAPCTYFDGLVDTPMIAIGWLSSEHAYSRRDPGAHPPAALTEKLREMRSLLKQFLSPGGATFAGHHDCELCTPGPSWKITNGSEDVRRAWERIAALVAFDAERRYLLNALRVCERRAFALKKGENDVEVSWADTAIDPTTLQLQVMPSADGVRVGDGRFSHERRQVAVWRVTSRLEASADLEISYIPIAPPEPARVATEEPPALAVEAAKAAAIRRGLAIDAERALTYLWSLPTTVPGWPRCLKSYGDLWSDTGVACGGVNLMVPGQDVVFVAPELVVHYMEKHGYQPPEEFARAVLACPPMGSPEYIAAVRAYGADLLPDRDRPRT